MVRLLEFAVRLLSACSVLAIAGMTLGTVVDVVIRQAGPFAVQGIVEIVTIAVVVTGFFALPASLREGQHIIVDLATHRLPRRTIRIIDAAWLALLSPALAGLAFVTWMALREVYLRNEILAELGLSASVIWFAAAVGLSVGAIAALHASYDNFRAAPNDDASPSANTEL